MADKIKCLNVNIVGNIMVPMAFLPEVVSFAIILIRNILTNFLRIKGYPVCRDSSVMVLSGRMKYL